MYCCGCQKEVEARLTDGEEIYPHRKDLFTLPFWKCDECKNYVGCHHKTEDRIKPLGNIPTKELREYRRSIHRILDPLWKNGRYKRKEIYAMLTKFLGREYHTGEIKDMEEAKNIYCIIESLYCLKEE